MPRWITLAIVVLAVLALLPFACIARTRSVRGPTPRLNVVSDMDNQPRFKSQQPNPLFADGRELRPPVDGTVAQGRLDEDERVFRGADRGAWVEQIPVRLTSQLLQRGKERYGIYCAPCHGLAGYGDGIVAARADRLQEGTWVPPSSYHADPVLSRPAGHLFNTITHGIRNMPSYGEQIPVLDRWAVVSYVRALQRSQHASPRDLPPGTVLP